MRSYWTKREFYPQKIWRFLGRQGLEMIFWDFSVGGHVAGRWAKPNLRLPDLKVEVCLRPELRPRGLGLTMSGASLRRLQRRGLALPKGAKSGRNTLSPFNRICQSLLLGRNPHQT